MEAVPPPRPYAPLIWAVGGLMAGYALAEATVGLELVGVKAVLALWAGVAAFLARKRQRGKIYLALAVMAAGALYYEARDNREAGNPSLIAPREAQLVIEVSQRFALREESGRVAGLGRVVSGPKELPPGSRIYYHLRWGLNIPLDRGAHVRAKGVLSPTAVAEKGSFEEYLEKGHIQWKLERGNALELAKEAPWPLRWVEALRRAAIDTLERCFDRQATNGLLPAMVVGARAEINKDQKEAFIKSGTMHLLAISGLNVMVVAGVFGVVGKLLGLRGIALWLGVVVATGLYAQVAGAAPSVLRAWGMVALAGAGYALRRQTAAWPILILAGLISLLVEPLSFWHAGWRLSFGVVAGMILGMGALERLLPIASLPFWARGPLRAVAVSIIAGISVAPMTACYFGLVQPWGWALNAAVVLIASTVTILGIFSVLLGLLPIVPEALNSLANGLLGLMEGLINAYLTLPGAVAQVAPPVWVEAVGTWTILGIFYILARFVKKRESLL